MVDTKEYTDVVLQECAPEVYIMLLNSVTPINVINLKNNLPPNSIWSKEGEKYMMSVCF